MTLGLAIGINDWEWGLGIGIGVWDLGLRLGLEWGRLKITYELEVYLIDCGDA